MEAKEDLRDLDKEEKQTPPPSTPPSIIDPEDTSPGYETSTVQKWLVVFTTSFVTLTACFSSTSLLAVASYVADDLHTTKSVIDASSAGVLFTMGLSNFVWGPLIALFGRLKAYNACIVMLLVWTIAAALSPNMPTFVVFRVLSGFQGTFFHVTGQAILAEYFPPVKRGNATGFFLCGTVLGPPLGPLIAGVVVLFASWRVILYVQCGMIVLGLVLSLVVLRHGGKAPTIEQPTVGKIADAYNPLKVIGLMRFPNLLLTDIACGLLSWAQYALLSSPHQILVQRFNITSPLISGLFYLSPAGGFLIGTIVGGRFSDRTVRQWIQRRVGLRLPQDRLRSGFLCWFVVIPASTLIYGWCTEKHIGGLALPLVFAFFAAAGILAAFAGLNTYCAEVMPLNRREAITTKYLVQYTCSAIAVVATLPLIDAVGLGLQCTISTIFVYLAGGLCVVTALYGIDMQNWVDARWPRTTGLGSEKSELDETKLEPVMSAA